MFMFNRTTTNRIRTGISSLIVAIMVLAVGGAAPSATADLLYSNLAITDNSTYTHGVQNYISNAPFGGGFWDVQVADDFTLADSYNITSVTADFFAPNGTLPADGVLVEFFGDVAGAPSGSASFAALTQNFAVTNFDNHLNSSIGMRFTVDLNSAGITLGSGTWWMAVTPVDETGSGVQYFQLRQVGLENGNTAHVRNGGAAHGNGYPGGWPGGAGGAWTAFGTFGGASNDPGDIAMMVEGTLVPAPGALALLGLAGLCNRRRRTA